MNVRLVSVCRLLTRCFDLLGEVESRGGGVGGEVGEGVQRGADGPDGVADPGQELAGFADDDADGRGPDAEEAGDDGRGHGVPLVQDGGQEPAGGGDKGAAPGAGGVLPGAAAL